MIYSGHETKIMINKSLRSVLKESAMGKIQNSLLKTIFLLIFSLSITCALCSLWWIKNGTNKYWYLEQRGNISTYLNGYLYLKNMFQKLNNFLFNN